MGEKNCAVVGVCDTNLPQLLNSVAETEGLITEVESEIVRVIEILYGPIPRVASGPVDARPGAINEVRDRSVRINSRLYDALRDLRMLKSALEGL